MLDPSPQCATAQEERVSNEGFRCRSEKQEPDDAIVTEAVLDPNGQALHSLATERIDLRLRSPDRREVELVRPVGELGQAGMAVLRRIHDLNSQSEAGEEFGQGWRVLLCAVSRCILPKESGARARLGSCLPATEGPEVAQKPRGGRRVRGQPDCQNVRAVGLHLRTLDCVVIQEKRTRPAKD